MGPPMDAPAGDAEVFVACISTLPESHDSIATTPPPLKLWQRRSLRAGQICMQSTIVGLLWFLFCTRALVLSRREHAPARAPTLSSALFLEAHATHLHQEWRLRGVTRSADRCLFSSLVFTKKVLRDVLEKRQETVCGSQQHKPTRGIPQATAPSRRCWRRARRELRFLLVSDEAISLWKWSAV